MLWVHRRRGMTLAILILRFRIEKIMKDLSIFVDESGDFGEYSHNCPYYIVTFVIHEQDNSIEEQINKLNLRFNISNSNIPAMHTAPLIRREEMYRHYDIKERKALFSTFFHFTRKVGIKYKNIVVDKKHKTAIDMNMDISKQLSNFVKENLSYFQNFDKIITYYDNGQNQLANILVSVFSSWFHEKFEYRVVSPYDYKLFQAADFICTLSLIEHKKLCGQTFTKSEQLFFGSYRNLKINYLKHLKKLEFQR